MDMASMAGVTNPIICLDVQVIHTRHVVLPMITIHTAPARSDSEERTVMSHVLLSAISMQAVFMMENVHHVLQDTDTHHVDVLNVREARGVVTVVINVMLIVKTMTVIQSVANAFQRVLMVENVHIVILTSAS